MLPDTFHVSLSSKIGMAWFCIISGWTTLATSRVLGGSCKQVSSRCPFRFDGTNSINMRPKQAEMDDVVQTIYEAINAKTHLQSTLFVLCGDHGMNEGGNHGGAGESETSPALVFISPKLKTFSTGLPSPLEAPSSGMFQYYHSTQQSDIAPTLAALLGFPIPLNNLGVLDRQMLQLWSEGKYCGFALYLCS